MTIVRVCKNKENPYVMLNKKFLNDPSLSLKAKGLLAYCLSKSDGWQFKVSQMVTVLKEGRDSLYSAFKELTSGGYCIVHQIRDKNGKFLKSDFILYEEPQLPDAENPDAENPHTGNPNTENPYSIINNESSKYRYKVKNEDNNNHDDDDTPSSFSSLEILGDQETISSADQSLIMYDKLSISPESKKTKGRSAKLKSNRKFDPPKQLIERATDVSTTEEEHQELLTLLGEDKLQKCYITLSNYKLTTSKKLKYIDIDFIKINEWVIGAVKDKELKDQNREILAKEIKQKDERIKKFANGGNPYETPAQRTRRQLDEQYIKNNSDDDSIRFH